MNRVLVTGAAGFIGSHFVDLILSRLPQESVVVALDALTYCGRLENLSDAKKDKRFEFIKGNIEDSALVFKLLKQYKIDTLVNFAAESHVDRSIESPAVFLRTNTLAVAACLDGVRTYLSELSAEIKAKFCFIQISTDEVYGALGETGHFTEETPYAPRSPYSASKAGGDLVTEAWGNTYGIPYRITHCSNNYGPRQFPEKLIPLMLERAVFGGELPIYGKGLQIRDWIHVGDHCEGIYSAIVNGKNGEHYCFGGNLELSNQKLVQDLLNALEEFVENNQDVSGKILKNVKDARSRIKFVQDRLGHDFRYAIDDSKAKSELGWKRRSLDFKQGLLDTVHANWIEWERAGRFQETR